MIEKKLERITLRVATSVKEAAEKKAYKTDRSLSYIVEKALMKDLGLLNPEM